MIKIKYPYDINSFENKYLAIFSDDFKNSLYNNFLNFFDDVNNIYDNSKLVKLLTASFDDLIDEKKIFRNEFTYLYGDERYFKFKGLAQINGNSTKQDKDNYTKKKKEFQKFLPYQDTYQSKIANFFRENLNGLSTCYFCNKEYINAYCSYAEYNESLLECFENGVKQDIEKLKNIGESSLNKILSNRNRSLSLDDFRDIIFSRSPNKKNDLIDEVIIDFKAKKENYDHFTLDHFIDKGSYPIFALSLYNLIPSCYTCNTKLKGQYDFGETLAPSSKNYNFNMKFKLGFTNIADIKKEKDFDLTFPYSDEYKDYRKCFKLQARYQHHKKDVLTMIENSVKYDDSNLKAISTTLKNGLSAQKIKEDIFGREVIEESIDNKIMAEKPLTKLKRDIYHNFLKKS